MYGDNKVSKALKKKFMNDDFVFSKKECVEMYCDDGEGVMRLIRSVDSDIHLALDSVHTGRPTSIRHRTSGSIIDMHKQLEITRTLNYLMALLEDAYDPYVVENQKKLIAERSKGNW